MRRAIAAVVLIFSTTVLSVTAPDISPAADRGPKSNVHTGPQTPAQRWDDIVVGTWYVPTSNLLAYLVTDEEEDPAPLGDQTIWRIERARNGVFHGESFTEFYDPTIHAETSEPITYIITGYVTPDGHIRINFDNTTSHVVGIGTMEFVGKQWRMTMQMGSGSDSFILHWANMTKLRSHETPPPPSDVDTTPSVDRKWGWLLGTTWEIRDTEFFPESNRRRRTPDSGIFEIEGYNGGYFWGSGTGATDFRVVGSVTPEGRLFLLLIPEDGDAGTRTGVLTRAGGCDWEMFFRAYEGDPEHGSAWLLDN